MIDPRIPIPPTGPRCQRCKDAKRPQERRFRYCGKCTGAMMRGEGLVIPEKPPASPEWMDRNQRAEHEADWRKVSGQ